MRLDRRVRLAALVCSALLALAACRPRPPASSSESGERIARLERGIADAQSHEAQWKDFMERLHGTQPSDLFACFEGVECVNADEWGVYDPALLRRISDPALLRDHPRDPGPLQALVDFARQLREHGIDLLVVVVPAKTTLFPEVVHAPGAPDAKSGVRPDFELRRLWLALEREGIEVLDLYDAFAAARSRVVPDPAGHPFEERIYRARDIHWTSYGASIAADAIAARVRRYPWFDALSSELGRTRVIEATVWSDAPANQVAAARAAALNQEGHAGTVFERLALHHVFPEGKRLLAQEASDPSSPVLVIGDSFANEYSRFGEPAGLPEHLLRALGFSVDVVAMGHGSPYTARAALPITRPGLRGKKLVIHEMHAVAPSYWDEWKLVDVFAQPAEHADGGTPP